MKKHHYLLLILLLLCGLGYGTQRIINSKEKEEINEQSLVKEEDSEEGVDVVEKEHALKLTIISPEEETFIPRQARMYNSILEGNQKYDFASVRCNWKFYLNENNEETHLSGACPCAVSLALCVRRWPQSDAQRAQLGRLYRPATAPAV